MTHIFWPGVVAGILIGVAYLITRKDRDRVSEGWREEHRRRESLAGWTDAPRWKFPKERAEDARRVS